MPEKESKLTRGTSLERIGYESLTRPDSGFVHRNMWPVEGLSSPDAESVKMPKSAFRVVALTFAMCGAAVMAVGSIEALPDAQNYEIVEVS